MNILVTGGASGLGEAITKTLASLPAHTVYFTYHRSAAQAKEIERAFPNAKGLPCDFTSKNDLLTLAAGIETHGIQVLVNNATTGLDTVYFHKMKPEKFLERFEKNILPVITITQAAIAQFRKQKFGKIITILSDYVVNKPPIGLSEYVAGKCYLHSLSKSWASENSQFNITSNCISPSFMLTSLTGETDERVVAEMTARHPLKQLLQPAEVAEAVSYFVHASQQVNGINFIINAAQNVI